MSVIDAFGKPSIITGRPGIRVCDGKQKAGPLGPVQQMTQNTSSLQAVNIHTYCVTVTQLVTHILILWSMCWSQGTRCYSAIFEDTYATRFFVRHE